MSWITYVSSGALLVSFDPEKHHRRSIRLRAYDYSQAGAYFVTICTANRTRLFGDVVSGKMRLNDFGRIVHAGWLDLPAHNADIELDAFVVMPNHVHGIVVLLPPAVGVGSESAPATDLVGPPVMRSGVGWEPAPTDVTDSDRPRVLPPGAGWEPAPAGSVDFVRPPVLRPGVGREPAAGRRRHGLPEIVRGFKTFTARRINERRGTTGIPVWQRGYYERVVRDDHALYCIRRYIVSNPARSMTSR